MARYPVPAFHPSQLCPYFASEPEPRGILRMRLDVQRVIPDRAPYWDDE